MSEQKQLTVADKLSKDVETMKPQFQLILPSNIDASKFIRTAQTLIKTNPFLQKCTPVSIFSSLMKCAQDGLMPDNRLSAIVPFGDQAQYMIMTQGILERIKRTSEVNSIFPEIVYSKDKFELFVDQNGKQFKHTPNYEDEDRGHMVMVYAVAKLKNGESMIEVMTKNQVDKVRASSKQKDGPTWKNWYEEMAKKTVIRRIAKYLPNSSEIDSMLKTEDDELYEFQDQPQKLEEPKKQLKIKDKLLGVKNNVEVTNNEGSGKNVETKSEDSGRLETEKSRSEI